MLQSSTAAVRKRCDALSHYPAILSIMTELNNASIPTGQPHLSAKLALRSRFLKLGRSLTDIIYPPQCIGCRAAVSEPSTLCARCWSGLKFIERPYCERLGTPFAVDIGAGLLSPAAIAEPPVFDRARSVVLYDGLGRALVHRLKYGDRLDLALAMARMMRLAGRELIEDADLIVPVPLHWTRLLSRRFNQAALLASTLARITGVPDEPGIMKRRKRTRPQYGLSRSERQLNLQGALIVGEMERAQVEGRHILLIDDVMTTASTANAAARALLKAKASHVDILTFARVVNSA